MSPPSVLAEQYEHKRPSDGYRTETKDMTRNLPTPAERDRDPKICPTDDEAIIPRVPSRKLDKQTWEYVIKSGVAGGLAGCAV
jgi:hypothetical protein